MYGKNYDEVENQKFQNEETKFLPQSPYAIAKCAAHFMVRLYREGYGIHASAGILPKLRLGNLEAFRDWGYAGDYVRGMWMMLQQDIPDDYVVCTGETHTIKEFLDVAFNHVKIKDWSGYVVQDPKFYRPAEVDYLRGDNSKAEEKLGWIPETSFEELVKMMVDHDLQT
jgi:GDPmannose 4,6-dehydratase